MDTKVCIKCGIELPNTSEFFFEYKKGLYNRCKKCYLAYNRDYRKITPEKHKIYAAKGYLKKKMQEDKMPMLENFLERTGWIDGYVCCNDKFAFHVYGYNNSISIETVPAKINSQKAIDNAELFSNGESFIGPKKNCVSTAYHDISKKEILDFVNQHEGLKSIYWK